MEKKLKDLSEHNNERFIYHWELNNPKPIPNGIECPNCKKELVDTNPMATLTSHPPQKNVHCLHCDYVGYRIA
jgi:hypothetical protein